MWVSEITFGGSCGSCMARARDGSALRRQDKTLGGGGGGAICSCSRRQLRLALRWMRAGVEIGMQGLGDKGNGFYEDDAAVDAEASVTADDRGAAAAAAIVQRLWWWIGADGASAHSLHLNFQAHVTCHMCHMSHTSHVTHVTVCTSASSTQARAARKWSGRLVARRREGLGCWWRRTRQFGCDRN